MTLIFSMLLSSHALAYQQLGNAKYCTMNEWAILRCYYNEYLTCFKAAQNHYNSATCVKNPKSKKRK